METKKRIETTTETVLNACRAAYKKGLIDAAQVICSRCRESRPEWRSRGIQHGDCFGCAASEIIEILELAGGWQADWPKPDYDSAKR